MKLSTDLYDVYGRKIAGEGREINRRLIRELVEKGAHLPQKNLSVAHTHLLRDFNRALNDPRYRTVFKSPATRKKLAGVFSRLKLTQPVLFELKHMKDTLPDTYHHVLTMAALVIKMIHDLKTAGYDPVLAASLCLTHDIGKTRIPKKILNKKGRLTDRQYDIIQTHPTIGFLLMSYYRGKAGRQYCETAYEHHEKLDGSGYPRGLKRIDRYAQLIAPVDIYDALISKRPYRKMSYNGRLALDILLEDAQRRKLKRDNVYLLINCLRQRKVVALDDMVVSSKRRSAAPSGNYYGNFKKEKARNLLKKD